MHLKQYQTRVLREVKHFLDRLAHHQAAGANHPSLDAWSDARNAFFIPGIYTERHTGAGADLPTFCIKVPTGGGKTLLAAHVVGLAHQTILKHRNGAGLVLWIVPSDQIYRDTLRALRDRRHLYREALEQSVSRRVEVWEKHEIHRLSPFQLASNLNVLLLKLPSTNRADREQLKFFRDSGGNIVLHFPPEDDPEKHRLLKQRIPNLEMLAEDEERGSFLLKTSLANLVRLSAPVVILDEGHKATSALARDTIESFNPSLVVELSATPREQGKAPPPWANILTRVNGEELLEEQMIKLPINVACSSQKSWKDCLTLARDKRAELAGFAQKHYHASGRLIRPIVLVQVERTGNDQRGGDYVHSEDVKEHLMQRLNVPQAAIAIKSASRDDIENIDLLDEGCPIEWIITKSALQEGWDCPFAYVLVSLNNTASRQSMTQLVGRVLRQPDQARTEFSELNESYVFCLRKRAGEITAEVKNALEKEGYTGTAASVVDRTGDTGRPVEKRRVTIRPEHRKHYLKPFEGKIYLPRFCVKNGRKEPEKLDYYRHLISQVDVGRFDYESARWDLSSDLAAGRDTVYRITLGQDTVERVGEDPLAFLEDDRHVQAWLVANLPFDHYSHKQLRRIVSGVVEKLTQANPDLPGKLALVKFALREKIVGFIERETDRQTEAAFAQLFASKKLCFFLECVECRFEIPETIDVRPTRQLSHDNGDLPRKSLFDYIRDEDFNEYERSVALVLDEDPKVLWWYRNLVGQQYFAIQGFRRDLIYPDFVVQEGQEPRVIASVLVLETKGDHLAGNTDTRYKRSVADYFEKVGHKVSWQKLAEEFADHTFRFQVLDEGTYPDQSWRDELRRLLGNGRRV